MTRPVLADAVSDSNALSILLGALGLFVGGLIKAGYDLWKARKEANRVSRADTIKEWSDLADRLKADIKEIQARDREREQQVRDMLKENADCIAHHERTAIELDLAKRRIVELDDELLSLRVKTAKDYERTTHTMKSVTGLVLDNTAGIAALAAKVEEPPPDDAGTADVSQS